MKKKELEGDIDLFATTISPLVDEDRIREIAYRNGWSVGYTELGTPSITMNIDGVDVRVDLYENILDFYIPSQFFDVCKRSICVEGVDIAYIAVECWAVLKAKRGSYSDLAALSMLKQFVDSKELAFDLNLVKNVSKMFEEEEKYILDRLRSVGFKV